MLLHSKCHEAARNQGMISSSTSSKHNNSHRVEAAEQGQNDHICPGLLRTTPMYSCCPTMIGYSVPSQKDLNLKAKSYSHAKCGSSYTMSMIGVVYCFHVQSHLNGHTFPPIDHSHQIDFRERVTNSSPFFRGHNIASQNTSFILTTVTPITQCVKAQSPMQREADRAKRQGPEPTHQTQRQRPYSHLSPEPGI